MPYLAGDLVRVSMTVETSGIPTDPTTVVFKHKSPSGAVTTWTFGVNSQVVKDGVGIYRADIDVNAGGTWNFRWECSGAAQGAIQDSFTALAANI